MPQIRPPRMSPVGGDGYGACYPPEFGYANESHP